MNWGNKLMIVFLVFAGLMATLVYKAVNTKYELVSKDYYKDELRYQDKIDGVNNSNKIGNISVNQDESQLVVSLPKEMKGIATEGEIWLYCSSDESKDRKIALQVDEEGRQFIAKNTLRKGNYQLKLTYKSGGSNYYSEQNLTVN